MFYFILAVIRPLENCSGRIGRVIPKRSKNLRNHNHREELELHWVITMYSYTSIPIPQKSKEKEINK